MPSSWRSSAFPSFWHAVEGPLRAPLRRRPSERPFPRSQRRPRSRAPCRSRSSASTTEQSARRSSLPRRRSRSPVRLTAPAGGTCLGGTADGTGAVALGVRDAAGSVTWHATSGDGRPQGTFAAQALVSAPDGWQGLASDGALVDHVSIAPDGRVRRASAISPDPALHTGFRWQLAQDPSGGSVVLFRSVTVAGNHWNALDAFRFDASGAPRWPEAVQVSSDPDAAEPYFMAAGVSTTGAALLLFQDSAFLRARWLEPSGAPHADAADPEASAAVVGEGLRHDVELAPLLDGSLALRSDGTWRRRYAPLATRSEPLPAWLAERARLALPVHARQRRLRCAPAGRRGVARLHRSASTSSRPRAGSAAGSRLREDATRLHDRRARPGLGRHGGAAVRRGRVHVPLVAAAPRRRLTRRYALSAGLSMSSSSTARGGRDAILGQGRERRVHELQEPRRSSAPSRPRTARRSARRRPRAPP